ncbi:MAG: hypothetical protein QOH45_400 [Pseudonocardiales bacterium]|nr:hypothetical protein [Pseudonocardiales bacterium]
MPIMGSWNRPIVLVSSPDPESAPVSAAFAVTSLRRSSWDRRCSDWTQAY